MPTPRKYDFKPGPYPLAACEILEVSDPGGKARSVSLVIKSDCCGRVSKINWQGMISRTTRGTGMCWKCSSDAAMERSGRRVSLCQTACDRGHEDFIEPPAWPKPKSIKTGYRRWGR